jgi:hypothetical protein
MPDYSKGKIYSIRSFQTDDVYIGSTTQTLAQRLGKHREKYISYLKSKTNYVSANEILKYDDYYIELITLYPCSCKAELEAEEGKFIREWDCVNKQIPGRTKKQWNFDNRYKIKEQLKQYANKHKEEKKVYDRIKTTCLCSCNITRINLKRHIKTKKHKDLMKLFIENFISQ